MKKLLFTIICLYGLGVQAQNTLKIKGKLLNCIDRVLEINPTSDAGTFSDSILVQKDGTFSYETHRIKHPFQANITNRKQIQIQVFLAPGYDLEINGDVKDYETAKKTLRYTGIGGATNRYWEIVQANFKPDTTRWHLKDVDTYTEHLKSPSKNTAAINLAFGPNNKDTYRDHFKNVIELNQKFGMLTNLLSMYAYHHNYNWQQIENTIKKLGFSNYKEELNKPQYLVSSSFCFWVESFPFYCDEYNAYPADSLEKSKGNYKLYLASKLFKGKVYDYVANKGIKKALSSVYKLGDIQKLRPYIDQIGNQELRSELQIECKKRALVAAGLQAGKPSPTFNLPDTSGILHQLSAFKGKVVYIDLWASWCGPCKEQNPFLKKVYEQYKNNNQIAIISIAAFDAKNRVRRYDIIKKEGMNWLQLEDTNDSFAKSYLANFIPRFIILDKKGNIVDSDAPEPSEGNKLTDILNREIGR